MVCNTNPLDKFRFSQGGEGGNLLYGLYRYVEPVWCLSVSFSREGEIISYTGYIGMLDQYSF